jgi:hypothetical protein
VCKLGFARLAQASILLFGDYPANYQVDFEGTMKKIIAVLVSSLYLSVPVLAAEESHMDKAGDAAGEAWESTKEASSEAWEATKEGTEKAWDATKDAVGAD